MSGLELVKKLVKANIQSDHIIALTAESTPKDIKIGLALGIREYLTKPVSLDRLVTIIKSVH